MMVVTQNESARKKESDLTAQFLVFLLENEVYAVDIKKVQKIKMYDGLLVTPAPNAPPFLIGVCVFENQIVPIVDLRIFYNIGQANYERYTVVIIVDVGHKQLGMVVDGVSNIVSMNYNDLKDAPEHYVAYYITKIANIAGKNVLILSVDLFAADEKLKRVAYDELK